MSAPDYWVNKENNDQSLAYLGERIGNGLICLANGNQRDSSLLGSNCWKSISRLEDWIEKSFPLSAIGLFVIKKRLRKKLLKDFQQTSGVDSDRGKGFLIAFSNITKWVIFPNFPGNNQRILMKYMSGIFRDLKFMCVSAMWCFPLISNSSLFHSGVNVPRNHQ